MDPNTVHMKLRNFLHGSSYTSSLRVTGLWRELLKQFKKTLQKWTEDDSDPYLPMLTLPITKTVLVHPPQSC